MNTFKKSAKLFLLVLIFFCQSCKKDKLIEESPNPGTTYNSLGDFFAQNKVPTQTFVINPQAQNTITGTEGTSFNVYPNMLVDSLNQPPSGNVTVQLIEIYNIKDMVLANMPTVSGGKLLQSGGEIFIRFESNGISYHPLQGLTITMPKPNAGPSAQNAELFWGIEDSTVPGISWVPASNGNIYDSSGTYFLSLTSLNYNWLNCDAFYDSTQVTDVQIMTQTTGANGETIEMYSYLVFKSINSMMGLYTYSSPGIYTASSIPVGMQAAAVSIGVGKVTKKPYFGKSNFTVSQTQTVSISLLQMTAEEIKTELQNL